MKRQNIFIVLIAFIALSCAVETPPTQTLKVVKAKPIKSLFHIQSGTGDVDSLYPIWPNPFSRSNNDTTLNIQYSTKDTSNTLILIQNPIGDEIARFVDSTLPSGRYQGSWIPVASDGSALNPGLYFITLRVNDTIQSSGYINSRLVNINDN